MIKIVLLLSRRRMSSSLARRSAMDIRSKSEYLGDHHVMDVALV
jgi:hypothetical protein